MSLYYFGARYYDARISRWISTDPALSEFLPTGNKKKDENLPAGGVFETTNIDLYGYVGANPLKYIDPDGNFRFGKRPLGNYKAVTVLRYAGRVHLGFITMNPLVPLIQKYISDKKNIELVHEHGFYDNSNENIGYGDKGYMYKENISDYKMEDVVYDDVLMKQAEKNVKKSGQFDDEGKKYRLFFNHNNCQDFADALRKEYNKLYQQLDDKGKKEVDARVEVLKQKIQQEENKK